MYWYSVFFFFFLFCFVFCFVFLLFFCFVFVLFLFVFLFLFFLYFSDFFAQKLKYDVLNYKTLQKFGNQGRKKVLPVH